MLENFKNTLLQNYANSFGWHTKRKIVVFESDDWGSIRMPSKETYNYLLSKNIRVDLCPYCKYDTLESSEDLELLFDLLKSFSDKNGNNAVITSNVIVANPDFDKIKNENFNCYFYEPFTYTLKKKNSNDRTFALYEEGISGGLFHPQFHGREHLNIQKWLNSLQTGNEVSLLAFENRLFCVSGRTSDSLTGEFTNAFASSNNEVVETYEEIIKDGLNIFNELFHFYPDSFIAPGYSWGSEVERITSENGIKYLQGNCAQYNSDKKRSRYNYLGKKNDFEQIYLIRNCFFEPSQNPSIDWVSSCLKDMHTSFLMHKPAIISIHRLNLVGGIDMKRRDENLKLFSDLLREMVNRWPEIEFMTSDLLGEIIKDDRE